MSWKSNVSKSFDWLARIAAQVALWAASHPDVVVAVINARKGS